MSAARVARIALPGLAALASDCAIRHEVARLPAAEWTLARGTRRAAGVAEWRRWLLAGAGPGDDVLDRFPAGPCVLAARGGSRPEGTWACAEPVHLLTALDHLQLAAPAPVPLAPADRDELVATLNRHFADRGFELHATESGGWLCACPPGLWFAAVEPHSALGGNLRDFLPDGPDAARVRSLVNEVQMMLHEHPVNERRVARGEPAVNSIWLWGVGAAGMPRGAAAGVLVTDDEWLAGLWRLHGGEVRPTTGMAEALGTTTGTVRVAVAPATNARGAAAELERLERQVFEPLRESLVDGRIAAAELYVGGSTIGIDRRARLRFWRRVRTLPEALR